MFWITAFPPSCCSEVLFFEEPSCVQYDGFSNDLTKAFSANSGSGSTNSIPVPVTVFISITWLMANPTGVSTLSQDSSSVYLFSRVFSGSSCLLAAIFSMSLMAISQNLKSRGTTPAATSIASLDAVSGRSRHRATAFLWIFSSFLRSGLATVCQTEQPYSITDLIKVKNSSINFFDEILAIPFTSLRICNALLAFLSVLVTCFWKFNCSSSVIPNTNSNRV